jgi:hypothetical protein
MLQEIQSNTSDTNTTDRNLWSVGGLLANLIFFWWRLRVAKQLRPADEGHERASST